MSTPPRRPVARDYRTYYDEQMPPCVRCGDLLDAATEARGERGRPVDGNVSICLNCGFVDIFTGVGLERRPPTAAEQRELVHDLDVMRVQSLLTFLKLVPGPDGTTAKNINLLRYPNDSPAYPSEDNKD